MMAAAQRDAVLVREGDDVMGVHVAQGETHQAAAFPRGAQEPDSRQRAQRCIGQASQRMRVLLDGRPAELVEIVAGEPQGCLLYTSRCV